MELVQTCTRTWRWCVSMSGARFAVFARCARVLPSPSQATRTLSLNYHEFTNTNTRSKNDCQKWCWSNLVFRHTSKLRRCSRAVGQQPGSFSLCNNLFLLLKSVFLNFFIFFFFRYQFPFFCFDEKFVSNILRSNWPSKPMKMTPFLCYYFKWYTVLLNVFCSSLLPRVVCGGTAIIFYGPYSDSRYFYHSRKIHLPSSWKKFTSSAAPDV